MFGLTKDASKLLRAVVLQSLKKPDMAIAIIKPVASRCEVFFTLDERVAHA